MAKRKYPGGEADYITLSKPIKVINKSQSSEKKKIRAHFQGLEVNFTEDQKDEIMSDIKKMTTKFDKASGNLHEKLNRFEPLFRGEVDITDFPFGPKYSSQATMKMQVALCRIIATVLNRVILRNYPIFMPIVFPGKDDKVCRKVGNLVNWVVVYVTNILNEMKCGLDYICRDGTHILQILKDFDIEKVLDVKHYDKYEAFVKDYPTIQDGIKAGMTEKQYKGIIRNLERTPVRPQKVHFWYPKILYNGIKGYTVELKDMIWYPYKIIDLQLARMYGKVFWETREEMQKKIYTGRYDEDNTEEILEQKPDGDADGGEVTGMYKNCEVTYVKDMDEDGIPERYLITFNKEKYSWLRGFKYPVRNNLSSMVPFRIKREPGMWIGWSLLEIMEDLCKQIDVHHRIRQNDRMLRVPKIMVDDKLKNNPSVDPAFGANVIQPAWTIWLPKREFDAIKQFALQHEDISGGSPDEEGLIMKYLQYVIGITDAMFGRESLLDPRGSKEKWAISIRQSSVSVEEWVDVYGDGTDKLAQLVINMMYQESKKDKIEFGDIQRTGDITKDEIERYLLADAGDLKMKIAGTSLLLNPEVEMAQIDQTIGMAFNYLPLGQMAKEILTRFAKILIELWNRKIELMNFPNKKELMFDTGEGQSATQESALGKLEKLMSEMKLGGQEKRSVEYEPSARAAEPEASPARGN